MLDKKKSPPPDEAGIIVSFKRIVERLGFLPIYILASASASSKSFNAS